MALLAAPLEAQLRPLHVSAAGQIVDDLGKAVTLRGVSRSGTGSGNAEGGATDAEYAAQNRLLSMNAVRIFVNAAWWNANVQVPLANARYQDYIDQLIQRAKKYGNYALIVKAGQFPDAPCGADGKNCPQPNQGDLNCAASAALCAQDTTGNDIEAAFTFWTAFASKYGGDAAVLFDSWEDMHGISAATWGDNQNILIGAIRAYAPQSLIFVEDIAGAFDAIVAGTLPDFAWPNIVWNFHLFSAASGACTQAASPRLANWPRAMDPLVSYATQHGHGLAIGEWGGCAAVDPYFTDITNYAKLHSMALAYFDSANLLTAAAGGFNLTAAGARVAQAYTALAQSPATPVISAVVNIGGGAAIAPNTWVVIAGSNLAPAGRAWEGSDFSGGRMPAELDGVTVTVNGKNAFVFYISPGQVNVLTPPDAMQGPVAVRVANGGVASAPFTVQAQALAPSFFVFGAGPHVAAVHANGALIGPATLYPGLTSPAKPGETILLFASGFGPVANPVVSGSVAQSGALPAPPVVRIGGVQATVAFAGLVGPGEFQFNVVVPQVTDGNQPISATYGGGATQPGTQIAVQR